jgi:hypothetical protein
MLRRFLFPSLIVLILPLLMLAAAACSDDDDNGGTSNGATNNDPAAQEVQQTIRNAVAAYNRQDLEGFMNFWTDDGLEEEFGATREQMRASPEEVFGGPPLNLRNITNTSVNNDRATADVELVFGTSLSPEKFELVRQGGAWKINGSEQLQANIPSGTTAIDLDLDEFSFTFDRGRLGTGNVAFRADNVGDQPHEVVLIKVTGTTPLTQLLQQFAEAEGPDDLPQGAEPFAFAGPVEPGDDTNMVFTEPLTSGRYLMVCFLPDEDDPEMTPHALKGMTADFRIN